jgi:hypothetical protein
MTFGSRYWIPVTWEGCDGDVGESNPSGCQKNCQKKILKESSKVVAELELIVVETLAKEG